ncbi:hypothetical protein RN001_008532 [Aquatica leii]|uniref:DNA-directed DNA polymerase n=1 Tax=Aquatica leii TaxID=1421715 RepID=A0AAN7PFX9_9COLE|nr:hypothetical protein RN001_008532 [Aquatica leii]
MKGYDGAFILKSLFKNPSAWNPKIITTGTKLMSINCDSNIKFIDSINYMPMPLSKLPKTFNFPGTKGYFPHFFNTVKNQNYVGPMPPAHYYGCDEMSTSNRNDFLKWYEEQVNNNFVFDFKTEIIKYCVADVDILRKACLDFWTRFTTSNGVDPFIESCTIAGACNLVFRRNYIHANSIGLIPPNGYRMADKQSVIAIQWLLWLEYSLNIKIQHAGNNREVRLKEGFLVFVLKHTRCISFMVVIFTVVKLAFPIKQLNLAAINMIPCVQDVKKLKLLQLESVLLATT